ncbi:MAG: hypothetical protein KDK39_08585 [Leptospiraceae bacterium]|nr:hypothetical protein [Leptospiraceae bacterium]
MENVYTAPRTNQPDTGPFPDSDLQRKNPLFIAGFGFFAGGFSGLISGAISSVLIGLFYVLIVQYTQSDRETMVIVVILGGLFAGGFMGVACGLMLAAMLVFFIFFRPGIQRASLLAWSLIVAALMGVGNGIMAIAILYAIFDENRYGTLVPEYAVYTSGPLIGLAGSLAGSWLLASAIHKYSLYSSRPIFKVIGDALQKGSGGRTKVPSVHLPTDPVQADATGQIAADPGVTANMSAPGSRIDL